MLFLRIRTLQARFSEARFQFCGGASFIDAA